MMNLIRDDDDGFTLIELLIVIAILAILISIVTLNVTNVLDSVNATAMGEEQRLVQLAIDRYNSWDVLVNNSEAIAASSGKVKVSASTPQFGKYLSSESRYYYSWGAGGTSLAGSITP